MSFWQTNNPSPALPSEAVLTSAFMDAGGAMDDDWCVFSVYIYISLPLLFSVASKWLFFVPSIVTHAHKRVFRSNLTAE